MAKKKTKKAPKPKLSAGEQMEFESRVRSLSDEIKERAGAYEQKRAAAKSAKEMLAGSRSELERLTWEFTHPEAMPLFRDHPNGKTTEPAVLTPLTDRAWREIVIRDALKGLGKKVYDGMERLQLDTVGKVIDWKNAKPDRWWTDVEGVGKAACDKIDDAIAAFFAEQTKQTTEKIGQPSEASE